MGGGTNESVSTVAVSAPAAAAPASSAPAEVSSTPADGGGAPSAPGEESPDSGAGAGSDLGAADAGAKSGAEEVEFDWSAWDGSDDAVPEPYRPVAKGVSAFYSKKYGDYDKVKSAEAKARQEMEELRTSYGELESLYNKMLEGWGEDPRLGEVSQAKAAIEKELESIKQEFDSYRGEILKWQEEEAKAYADRLVSAYPKYFSDDAHKAKLSGMIELGFDAEYAIQILDLGEQAAEAAKAVKAEGVTDQVALKFAKLTAESGGKQRERRDAAKVMAGADPAQTPMRATKSLHDAKSHKERVGLAIARNLKVMGGGR